LTRRIAACESELRTLREALEEGPRWFPVDDLWNRGDVLIITKRVGHAIHGTQAHLVAIKTAPCWELSGSSGTFSYAELVKYLEHNTNNLTYRAVFRSA
jgi:hypothetical protein